MAEVVSVFSNVIVRESNTVTITCEAIGYPPPTIVWSRSNGALSDRVSVNNSVSAPTGNGNVTRVSVNLTITNISREDRGDYICFTNNSIGSDSTAVTVESKRIYYMDIIIQNFAFSSSRDSN